MNLEYTPLAANDWKAALLTLRTQLADYEREGTSTPGKLKRQARLRACRMALRDTAPQHAGAVTSLKRSLAEIEAAEKDDNWRRLSELIPPLLVEIDGYIGSPEPAA